MNKSLVIHFVWAVVAIVAFMVGTERFSENDSSNSSSGEQRDDEKLGGRSSAHGANSSRRSRLASRGNQRDGATQGKVNLTGKGIKSLGIIMKTSNDPIERRIAFSKLLEGLTSENAEVLREQIMHMSSGSSEWKDFHYAWGSLAGKVAVDFGAESEEIDRAAALSGWASSNPQAALTWYNNLSAGEQNRRDLKWSAVYGFANTDTQLATNYVMQRQEVGDKDAGRMMSLIAKAVLRTGNSVEAARWSTSLPDGNLQDAAVSQVARDYTKDDPNKAVSWLESLPESDGQSKGLGVAFSTWASRDADAAGTRLNLMEDSSARDSAVSGYARQIAYKNPRSAVDWASTITDEKVRNDTLVRNGRIYARQDREGARQWLAGSNLSPHIQKRIIGSGRGR